MTSRKELLPEISIRLKTIRNALGYSGPGMAKILGIGKSTYYRNEKGKTSPDLWTYYQLRNKFKVDLNWLIYGSGEMFLKEEKTSNAPKPELEDLNPDIIQLVNHMKRIPSLYHEILATFHHFKESHPGVVERGMKEQESNKP